MTTRVTERDGGHWVAAQTTPVQTTAVLAISTLGWLILGIQPLLLETLVLEQRLSVVMLGWAATAEFLTLALGIYVAGAMWRPISLRWRAAGAAVALAIVDLLATRQSGFSLVINRAVAGLPEAVFGWLLSCMIARSALPVRLSGISITIQNISRFAFTAVLQWSIMQRYGASGAFVALAFMCVSALATVPLLPRSFVELPPAPRMLRRMSLPSLSAATGLASAFLLAAFSIGLFTYIVPIGAQAHLDTRTLGWVVTVMLGAATLGSALAAVVSKLSYYPIFAAGLIVNAAVLMALASLPGPTVFVLVAAVFGFFWLFFLAFQVDMIIESDPTRRSAVILPAAQLLGGSAGPLFCSFFVTDHDARGALVVCGVCFLTSFMLATVLHMERRKRRRQAAEEDLA